MCVVVVFDIPVRHWIMALGCVKPSIQSAARYGVAVVVVIVTDVVVVVVAAVRVVTVVAGSANNNRASAMFKWSTIR